MFVPFRAVGLVASSRVPFAFARRGDGYFAVVPNGDSFHTFDGLNLSLLAVSRSHNHIVEAALQDRDKLEISAICVVKNFTVTAFGSYVTVWARGFAVHTVRCPGNVHKLMAFGNVVVASCTGSGVCGMELHEQRQRLTLSIGTDALHSV